MDTCTWTDDFAFERNMATLEAQPRMVATTGAGSISLIRLVPWIDLWSRYCSLDRFNIGRRKMVNFID